MEGHTHTNGKQCKSGWPHALPSPLHTSGSSVYFDYAFASPLLTNTCCEAPLGHWVKLHPQLPCQLSTLHLSLFGTSIHHQECAFEPSLCCPDQPNHSSQTGPRRRRGHVSIPTLPAVCFVHASRLRCFSSTLVCACGTTLSRFWGFPNRADPCLVCLAQISIRPSSDGDLLEWPSWLSRPPVAQTSTSPHPQLLPTAIVPRALPTLLSPHQSQAN